MLRRFVRASGWLAATAFVLLAGLWLASGWYWIFLSDTRVLKAHVQNARIDLTFNENYRHATLWAWGERPNGQFPGYGRGTGWSFTWNAPGSWWPGTASGPLIDLAAASFVIALAGLFWPMRRRRRGHCKVCDYDLTGNESGRCPECGTETATSPVLNARGNALADGNA